ncbi:MAG: energy transducer TonB [Betaproteobacteria bacterium]|nr:energy transducer TonB [Betaproteobacteria bacterium]
MTAIPMVFSSPPPPLSEAELRPDSRLGSAFGLAIVVEVLLLVGVVWVLAHRYTPQTPPPIEEVRLVQLPKPVVPPKPRVKPHPRPKPKVIKPRVLHRRIKPVMPPPPRPIPMPKPPAPLPPSPVAAPVLPPPKAVPPPVPLPNPGERATYLGEVRSAIQDAVRFPDEARLLRAQGKVQVRFDLRDGVVSHLTIVTPGGLGVFNANALSAVRDATLPVPPKQLAHKTFNLGLWVLFHFKRH